jgi:hypothetical protein
MSPSQYPTGAMLSKRLRDMEDIGPICAALTQIVLSRSGESRLDTVAREERSVTLPPEFKSAKTRSQRSRSSMGSSDHCSAIR